MSIHSMFTSRKPRPRRVAPAGVDAGPSSRRKLTRACVESLEGRRLLSFSPAVEYPTGAGPHAVVVADLNGDGRLDLATANFDAGTVGVLLGNGNGTFQQPAIPVPTGAGPRGIAVGDFTGDGRPDLVTFGDGGLSLLRNSGGGAFAAPVAVAVSGTPESVAVGDFNADGKLDLVATTSTYSPGGCWYYCYPGTTSSSATVLLGSGTGSFTSAGQSGFWYGRYTATAVADLNGDGKQDIATTSQDSFWMGVLFGSGTGTFPTGTSLAGDYSSSVTTGDVNGDGKTDLVTASAYSGRARVMLGNGVGGFADGQDYAAGPNPHSVKIADVNGDGKPDLVTANSGDATLGVLLNTGTGSFQPPLFSPTGSPPISLAIGDFNGDGKPDVATANPTAGSASVLINDGAWPSASAPRITIGDVTVTEGNAGTVNASFVVSLSAASAQTITVNFATADGSATAAGGDYQSTSGTLTFAPGETSKTITVVVNGDREAESNETFAVNLSGAVNAFVADGSAVGTILDDEPRITIEYASVREGNVGTTQLNFIVRLSAASDAPVSVNYSTVEGDTDWTPCCYNYYDGPPPAATSGVDFHAKAGTLTFAPGEVERTIAVDVIGDRVGEPDEVLSLNLSGAVGGVITAGHALGTIIDDEPHASISDATVVEGNAGVASMIFTVTLFPASDETVTVNYATADGSATVAGGDFQAKTGTLTFAPGVTSQSFVVLVNGDRVAEPNEYLSANLTGVTNAQITDGTATGYITDDEPRISITSAALTEGHRGTKVMTFTVTLSAAYDQAVSVNVSTANGSATVADGDYVANSATLTFAAGQTSLTFSVVINGDKKREADEYFNVLLGSASSNALISNGTALGTIRNDDGGKGKNNR